MPLRVVTVTIRFNIDFDVVSESSAQMRAFVGALRDDILALLPALGSDDISFGPIRRGSVVVEVTVRYDPSQGGDDPIEVLRSLSDDEQSVMYTTGSLMPLLSGRVTVPASTTVTYSETSTGPDGDGGLDGGEGSDDGTDSNMVPIIVGSVGGVLILGAAGVALLLRQRHRASSSSYAAPSKPNSTSRGAERLVDVANPMERLRTAQHIKDPLPMSPSAAAPRLGGEYKAQSGGDPFGDQLKWRRVSLNPLNQAEAVPP